MMTPIAPAMIRLAARAVALGRRFRTDRRGIAAIEFAFLAPVLIIAFIGTLELSEVITVNRKVTHAISTVGDLIGRSETISTTELNNIFDATEAVMSPYPTDRLKIVVATVKADNRGKPKVVQSRARNTAPWPEGATPPVAIPEGIDYSTQEILVTQAKYDYEAVFGSLAKDIIGRSSFALGDTFFMSLRGTSELTFE